MSDALRRHRDVHKALFDLYPETPKGNLARRLNTLTALICGIVGSRKTNLPKIAEYTFDDALPESRVKRFSRWIDNEWIDLETYFLPYAQALIDSLSRLPLFLVMDTSAVGRRCATLMLCVVYKKRALPIAWLVVKGNKGHFSEEHHIALLEQVQALIPKSTHVIFLGDGEFDGTDLQAKLDAFAFDYVCRTAKNIQISRHTKTFAFQEVGVLEGTCMSFDDVFFTLQAYGPVHAIAWWDKGYAEPIYLISNVKNPRQACRWYRKRFRIETFFSDQKSRGFFLHKSHLSDPDRLCRLLIAACLAYIWIIFLGILTIEKGWTRIIHRSDRCDLSLFQLGLKLLSYLVNQEQPIPVAFCWNLNLLTESVR
jgi:hypothetical protein